VVRAIRSLGVALLLCLFLAACGDQQSSAPNTPIAGPAATSAQDSNPQTPVKSGKGFDFYVLSLSWSPSYCEAEGADANRQQCASGRPYAFVVHGLWPQFERGYPADCPVGQTEVSRDIISDVLPIMPSTGLIRHQWRKHGSCAGLSQEDYFGVLRAARTRIAIPEEFQRLDAYRTVRASDVEAAFLESNQGLEKEGVAVTCDRRYLREVRICMTRGLEFRACPEIDRRDCRLDRAVMPPVRGG
jgi:ribonuclease T2